MSLKRRIGKMYRTRERLYDEYFYGRGKLSDNKLKDIRRRINQHKTKNKKAVKYIGMIMLRHAAALLRRNPEIARLCKEIGNRRKS